MSATLLKRNRRALVFGMIAGSALAVLAGLFCLLRLGDGLARISYDLPFVWSAAAASLSVHRTGEGHEGRYGVLRRLEAQKAFAWLLDATELPRLADSLNLLAAMGRSEGAKYDAPGVWDAVVFMRVDETLDGA